MSFEEALNLFDLNNNFQGNDLKTKYHQLMKLNHPDINKDLSATENTQKINEAYDILLNELKERKEEELLLENEKKEFSLYLKSIKLKYKNNKIDLVVDIYLLKILIIYSRLELFELKEKFKIELNKTLEQIKNDNEIQVKENLKLNFIKKFSNNIQDKDLKQSIIASNNLKMILEYIQNNSSKQLNEVFNQLSNINFNDVELDFEIIKKLNSRKTDIYINTYTGEIMYIKNYNNGYMVYSLKDDKKYYITDDIYEDKLISLNEYFDKCFCVKSCKISKKIGNDGPIISTNTIFDEYLFLLDDLMLVSTEVDLFDNNYRFISAKNEGFEWIVEPNLIFDDDNNNLLKEKIKQSIIDIIYEKISGKQY